MKTFNPLVFVQVRNIAPTMLFACLVFFAQVALGQETPTVKATIKGPSTALAGTLVFLSHQDAVGENKVWIIPEELKSQSATCGSNIFFSIPSPGKYQFGLIVADKTAAIDYQFHTIDVVGMLPTTPPGTGPTPVPTPVPTPTPVPSPNFDSLRVVSRTGIDTLKDASTTQLLQKKKRRRTRRRWIILTTPIFPVATMATSGNGGVISIPMRSAVFQMITC